MNPTCRVAHRVVFPPIPLSPRIYLLFLSALATKLFRRFAAKETYPVSWARWCQWSRGQHIYAVATILAGWRYSKAPRSLAGAGVSVGSGSPDHPPHLRSSFLYCPRMTTALGGNP